MRNDRGPMRHGAWCLWALAVALTVGALWPSPATAQVPARFYWKTLSGANAVPLIITTMNGNTNPFDQAHAVTPGANFEATLALAGYAHVFTLFDRSAMAAVLLPMGKISGSATTGDYMLNMSASGFGDPMLEFDISILGPPAQKSIPDALRYEPGFCVDVLADLAVPIGEYNCDQPLNIGQNRWYGRVGLPVVWQLGAWVPGRRTTLELLPAAWLFGDNDDFVGHTLETEPAFQLDAHLTRDLTEHLWGALDGVWYTGGKATVDSISGEAIDNLAFGLTLGYQINENLSCTFGYKSTVNDDAPEDLRMDGFLITLVSGWHPIIEGVGRLGSEE